MRSITTEEFKMFFLICRKTAVIVGGRLISMLCEKTGNIYFYCHLICCKFNARLNTNLPCIIIAENPSFTPKIISLSGTFGSHHQQQHSFAGTEEDQAPEQILKLAVSPGHHLWADEDLILECRVYNAPPKATAVWHRALLDPAGRTIRLRKRKRHDHHSRRKKFRGDFGNKKRSRSLVCNNPTV